MNHALTNVSYEDLMREVVKRLLAFAKETIDVTDPDQLTRDALRELAIVSFDNVMPDIIADNGGTDADDNSTGIDFYVQHFTNKIFESNRELTLFDVPVVMQVRI